MRQRKTIAEAISEPPADDSARPVLSLEAASGIEQARPLHAALLERLEDDQPVILEADRVEQVHGAVLQLLCLFARERQERGTCFQIAAPSPAFFRAASVMGAVDLLCLSRAPS